MTRPEIILRVSDGTEAVLGPGAIVGRSSGAALCIDDPRVSEAHALVSLRGGELVLLALRGELTVGRRTVSRVSLRPGVRVLLVPGVSLDVVAVTLPDRVLALRSSEGVSSGAHPRPPGAPWPLSGSACSITPEGEPRPGYVPEAAVHLWASDDGWRYRVAGQMPAAVVPGGVIEVGGHRFDVVEVPLSNAGIDATFASPATSAPISIVCRYETVHIHREGAAQVVLSGIQARMICEVIEFAAPVPWDMAARAIWKGENDRFVLRRNWDRHLTAMRQRLAEAGLRTDIVRADGCGNVEIFLHPGDTVEDQG